MARRRDGFVRESADELERLAGRFEGGLRELRLRMLLHLIENPDATDRTLSEHLRVGDRTVRRWWQTYRSEGIGGLLSTSDDAAPSTLTLTFAATKTAPVTDVSERFTRFLNALPTTFDSEGWVLQLKEGLSSILDGVDRVTVAVNVGSDIDEPDGGEIDVIINRIAEDPSGRRRRRTIAASSRRMSPGEAIIAQARASGMSMEEFRPPQYFDFHADGDEYVGTIILWTRRHAPPTPRSTIELVRSLNGFFTFLLSDCVARQLRRDPAMRVFKDVVVAIGYRLGLTPRQLEIFLLQMLGNDRDAIASHLNIAPSTVNKHIGAIHACAGTTNYNELLARFLSPLGDD